MEKVRHQLFLPKPVSDRFEALAAKPGASKSAILADAVTAWLDRRGVSELEDRFAIRLDRLTKAIGRVDRQPSLLLETLALFLRFELSPLPPLPARYPASPPPGAHPFEALFPPMRPQR